MKNWYFTFGTGPHMDHRGGYIVIKAKSYPRARALYEKTYGKTTGFLGFAFQYSEEEWEKIQKREKARYRKIYKESAGFEKWFDLFYGPKHRTITDTED